MVSVGSGNWFANNVGCERFQRWLSTDFHKNKQMMRLIYERAIEQLEHDHNRFIEISEEETYTIYHTQ